MLVPSWETRARISKIDTTIQRLWWHKVTLWYWVRIWPNLRLMAKMCLKHLIMEWDCSHSLIHQILIVCFLISIKPPLTLNQRHSEVFPVCSEYQIKHKLQWCLLLTPDSHGRIPTRTSPKIPYSLRTIWWHRLLPPSSSLYKHLYKPGTILKTPLPRRNRCQLLASRKILLTCAMSAQEPSKLSPWQKNN